jgi:hypothetical protein
MNTPAEWNYRDASVGLDGWRAELEQLHAGFVSLAGPLDAEQLNWQPAPEKWSIGSIVDHLNVTNRELLGPLRYTLAAAQARGVRGEPPFAYGWLGRWFLDEVAPPARRAARAPRKYWPATPSETTKQAVLGEFDRLHEALLRSLDDAAGLHLGKIHVRSPALWLLRLPVGIWFASVPAHAARHWLQARAVRETPGFPRG